MLQKSLQSKEFKTGMVTGSKQRDIAKIARKLVLAQGDSSKAVDANGEPLVVYYGRKAAFNEFNFDPERANIAIRRSVFSDNPEDASQYGANYRKTQEGVYPMFLDIKNPVIYDAEGRS